MEKQSSYLTSIRPKLATIIEALNEKYDYASALASDCVGTIIKVTNKEISQKDSDWQERGIVIRISKNGIISEYSFNQLPILEEVIEKVEESSNIDDLLEKSIYVRTPNVTTVVETKAPKKSYSRMDEYNDMSDEDIINNLKKMLTDAMEENEYIISNECTVEYVHVSKLFISEKKNMMQDYPWVNITYFCILNRDDTTRFNYGGVSGLSLAETFERIGPKIKQINSDAVLLLDSKHVTPGEYECIVSPEIAGLIAHEAFGHSVEMDMFVKNRSKAVEYIGKRVATDIVTMHDGAIPYKDCSSYFFDDEGIMAKDTVVIRDGILETGIADVISASKLKISPTGNGKRESFERKAYSRMTSTYFEPGIDKLANMIKSVENGFLIDTEMSGMEDPKGMGIQCVCLIGKEIKSGQFTGNIYSPIYMTGNVIDLLNSITMVSDDFELVGTGACGKGYKEWAKTAVGGPYMKAKVKLG